MPTIRCVLIDLEATCDAEPLPREQVEIIEIGAVLGSLSEDGFEELDAQQIYLRPTINLTLSAFCIELTGIEQHTVDNALTLADGLPLLAQWLSEQQVTAWGSWGNFDARQFALETEAKGLANPLAELVHINIKQRFAKKRKHRVGLGKAVELSGLGFIGRAHSGLDDARNIAQLLQHDGLLRADVLQRMASA